LWKSLSNEFADQVFLLLENGSVSDEDEDDEDRCNESDSSDDGAFKVSLLIKSSPKIFDNKDFYGIIRNFFWMILRNIIFKDNRSETSAQSTDQSATSGCNISLVEPVVMTK